MVYFQFQCPQNTSNCVMFCLHGSLLVTTWLHMVKCMADPWVNRLLKLIPTFRLPSWNIFTWLQLFLNYSQSFRLLYSQNNSCYKKDLNTNGIGVVIIYSQWKAGTEVGFFSFRGCCCAQELRNIKLVYSFLKGVNAVHAALSVYMLSAFNLPDSQIYSLFPCKAQIHSTWADKLWRTQRVFSNHSRHQATGISALNS